MNMPQGTGGRKFYIPVPQNQVIYSQFEHVSGFAAPGAGSSQDDQSGITVDKVQILNSLIDQLVSMKTKETAAASVPKLTENQIDSLIKEYQGKIHTTLTAEKENPNPYKKLPVPPTGAVFNLSV
jgi:Mor family transcriptional regulator